MGKDVHPYHRGYGQAWRRLRDKAKKEYPPVCHICGGPINMDLKSGPMMWSLDHLDPLAIYGTGLPPLDRCRPAHFGCNSSRGAKLAQRRRKPRPRSRDW
ncbi:hypothetical protein GCM10025782_23090 [Pedococcus ginsenosidimutans]|uniref:HNH endonuclease n=1 Tax=Pedococcus ginsenosidimutans TaxID=490570 RepID=A0ABP8YBV8_9MICO